MVGSSLHKCQGMDAFYFSGKNVLKIYGKTRKLSKIQRECETFRGVSKEQFKIEHFGGCVYGLNTISEGP